MQSQNKGRFWCALTLFSLIGQVAWVVENMYFNVFIYKMFSATAADISAMVAASAVAATLTSIFIGALSDRVGKRKLFICLGYILWGISICSFALIRTDIIEGIIPATVSTSAVGISLVIIMDCVMTFFGSSANDAAFNAWLTDSASGKNRGAAEGINAMMPLVAILAVFGGFMSFDLDKSESWSLIFLIIGIVTLTVGIVGIFIIDEPKIKRDDSGYCSNIVYGFLPRTVKENKGLYIALASFIIFNTSIQVFMPYLIIYYEVSLKMADYVLIMAPAIIIASIVTALWGRVYDKKGFGFSSALSLAWLVLGYVVLYVSNTKLPVFIGSLFMMCGYLAGMAVFGAKIRDKMPKGKSGRLQGVRIVSQVLLPGVVGPYIGKAVLSDAETMTGNDGTVSFVPSADIFLAALIVVLIVIPFILLVNRFDKGGYERLKTPYEAGDTPHDYYPRPQMKRGSFVCLNGSWKFSVAKGKNKVYDGRVTVPFPPEAELSGVSRVTKKNEMLCYERDFDFEPTNERVLLHFGAVDNECEVFLNGGHVGFHEGGYLPFSFDVTDKIKTGKNTIRVIVTDRIDKNYPWGKQKYNRGGMWYTPVSGIWQSVWIECVPQNYVEKIKITTHENQVTVEVVGGEDSKTVLFSGKEIPFNGDKVVFSVEDPVFWSPENPYIYDFSVKSGRDMVESYFALRDITIEDNFICLNGRPYFFHGILDQGYYSDGIYTPACEDGFKDDILKMKELGFNMLRKHIKIEPDIFYYYCDIYGMTVFQDMVNSGSYSFLLDTALPTLGIKKGLSRKASQKRKSIFKEQSLETLSLLENHPSVVYYTIFNEGWGQHDSDEYYKLLKKADPTRVYDTASGWFSGVLSDVQSEHVYFKPISFECDKNHPAVLSEFGGYSCKIEGHCFNTKKTYGYKKCADKDAFCADLQKLYMAELVPMIEKGLCAAVLTQLSDVEDETNGLVTYDRKVVKCDVETMKLISEKIFESFDKSR